MTLGMLIRRSLRFHWRSHLGVVLGAAVGSAALIGALIVGDSVRETLRERALARLGNADNALSSGDRFFTQELGLAFVGSTPGEASATLLQLAGTAANNEGTARAGNVQIFGVRNFFDFARPYSIKTNSATAEQWRFTTDLPHDSVLLNQPLATQLGVRAGDTVLLRIQKPSALSRDAVLTPQSDHSVALRLRVNGIIDAQHGGDLNLRVSQLPPLNAFMRLDELAPAAGVSGRANVILAGMTTSRESVSRLQVVWAKLWQRFTGRLQPISERISPDDPEQQVARLNGTLQRKWRVDDAELIVRAVSSSQAELSTHRIFLEDSVIQAATSTQAVKRAQVPLNASALRPGPLTNPVLVDELTLRMVKDAGLLPLNFQPSSPFISGRYWLEPSTSILSRAAASLAAKPRVPMQPVFSPVTNATHILTYLVNLIRAGTNATPYSMITAAGMPYIPLELRDDEIVVNEWLANDLQLKVGDAVSLTYFVADEVSKLTERTNTFRVHSIVPLEGIYADKTLMPEFPGLAKAESTHDWDAGFPLVHKIRDQDEAYWKQHRGTPKAFITLAAGQKMWANRFGSLTAIRWSAPACMAPIQVAGIVQQNLMQNLEPVQLGFHFEPVRQQALAAVSQSQDFGGLFIGFSFFLIIAALILMGLLFAFGLQQRAAEIGTLLALGFPAKRVRKLFLLEGAALALLGGVIGAFGGIVYAKLMLRGLTTIWRSATNTGALTFHVSLITLVIGLCSAVVVAVFTIWLVLRKQARQPARALLAGEWTSEFQPRAKEGTRAGRVGVLRSGLQRLFAAPAVAGACVVLVVATVAAAFALNETNNPGYFFSAGSFALISGLAFTSWLLSRMLGGSSPKHVTSSSLSIRGTARRKTRSVATVALLACGVFLIVAIGAFRLDPEQDAWKRSSGTGGFALIGESTLPIVKDLNTREGRDALGLDEKILQNVSFVPFRVREGDDASCLNLNRAQQPRLLGVNSGMLYARDAFSFAKWDKKFLLPTKNLSVSESESIWFSFAARDRGLEAVPAIGDAASIQWALHKKIGATLPYRDERGNDFDVRLVGGLANSILQGSLIIDEGEFKRRFPSVSGYRMFLIDCPSNALPQVSAELTRALQDFGFEVTPAAQRLAAFNAVQNTYLNTFQILGGLGLLLGSAGLGIVVLRNVLERRAELALLIAVGFRRTRVQKIVLAEHAALLCLGLVIGIVSALVAILPSVLSPRAEVPVQSLAFTLGGVLLFGMTSTWLAVRSAVRGNLLEGLRNE